MRSAAVWQPTSGYVDISRGFWLWCTPPIPGLRLPFWHWRQLPRHQNHQAREGKGLSTTKRPGLCPSPAPASTWRRVEHHPRLEHQPTNASRAVPCHSLPSSLTLSRGHLSLTIHKLATSSATTVAPAPPAPPPLAPQWPGPLHLTRSQHTTARMTARCGFSGGRSFLRVGGSTVKILR